MPGMYLRHPGFINSACGSFAKKKKKTEKKHEIQDIFIKTN